VADVRTLEQNELKEFLKKLAKNFLAISSIFKTLIGILKFQFTFNVFLNPLKKLSLNHLYLAKNQCVFESNLGF